MNRDIHEALAKVSDLMGGGLRPKSLVAGFLAAANQNYLGKLNPWAWVINCWEIPLVPQDLGRNWSLLGRVNQKQIRPQDQPGLLEALPEDDHALIRPILPEMGAQMSRCLGT